MGKKGFRGGEGGSKKIDVQSETRRKLEKACRYAGA